MKRCSRAPPGGKDHRAGRPEGSGGGRRFQHLRQRDKDAGQGGHACRVDPFRQGSGAACTAVHRDERCLPCLYHRLALAGHERHRGHPPDPQPEQ